MAYKVIILYQLYMPSYFLGTFTEYPYQVQAVPTLMLFKAGKMVWRQSGAMQATQIRQVIEKHL